MGATYSAMLDKHQQDRIELDNQITDRRKSAQEEYVAQVAEYRKSAEEQKDEMLRHLAEIKDERQQAIDIEINTYKEAETQKARTLAQSEVEAGRRWADASLAPYWDELAQRTVEKERELVSVQEEIAKKIEELEDYKRKQQAINEAILRERALEEQKDFYRIKLSDSDKQDIRYLLSIVDNIKNAPLLYKLIWSEYLQKPFSHMIKGMFEGMEVKCVIYKITNINTGEVYIGKTRADVSKRWTEHIKTSLNIGTVAKSKIHDALFKHWDEFLFEVVEVVKNEETLSQREKYYINFYQSNICGYNMNSGG